MNQKNVFLTQVHKLIVSMCLKCEAFGDSIVIQNNDTTPTVIQIEDLDLLGIGGRALTHRVTVSKRCAAPAPGICSPELLAKWNAFTSIFSAIPVEEGIDLVARVNLYEGAGDVAEHVYAPLIAWAAWLAPGVAAFMEAGEPNALSFLKGTVPTVDPAWFGISNESAAAPSSYTQDDLDEALAYARSLDLVSSGGGGGITSELPWDKDAKGVLYDTFFGDEDLSESGRTSLLVIELNVKHPLFGLGTLVQYRVPFVAKCSVAPMIDKLNRWDFGKGDLPPFFGSWCLDRSSNSPAYVSFMPNAMDRNVTLPTLVSWMIRRHKAVMTFLRTNGLSD